MTRKSNSEEPIPGSFFTRPPGEESTTQEMLEVKERSPEVHQDLVTKYNVFRESLHPKLDVIYHPSNATDVSPSATFPNSRIIYAEIDKNVVEALKKAGYESHYGSAAGEVPGHPEIPLYTPDAPVDVLILLNPAISSEIPSQYVTEGGYVLANDYHGTATQLKDNSQFQIVGIIRNDEKAKQVILDTGHPEDYWKEIETEEEFENAPFSWGTLNYEMAKNTVQSLTGKADNILAEYKKIIGQARKQERRRRQESWDNREKGFEEHLQAMKSFGTDVGAMTPQEIEEQRAEYEKTLQEMLKASDLENATEFMLNTPRGPILIEAGLPRKKGVVDDYFVFKKTAKQ